jgi:4-amino-4-deoxy-L-arabinose transferase-like glycosyltransferase
LALKFKHPSIYLATYKMMKKSFFLFFFFWGGGGIWPLKKPPKPLILGFKNLDSKEKKTF